MCVGLVKKGFVCMCRVVINRLELKAVYMCV